MGFEEERPASPPLEEKELVRGLRAGEARAIDDFLRRTHRPVFAMTCRFTSDPELRRDWTHDILLGILEELRRGSFVYRWPGCFWSWFRKRTRFFLLNRTERLRKQGEREIAGDAYQRALDSLPHPEGRTPQDELERVEARAAIEECLSKLENRDQRVALELCLLEELSYREIADSLEAELNTVRSWIRRARILVRRCIEEKIDR